MPRRREGAQCLAGGTLQALLEGPPGGRRSTPEAQGQVQALCQLGGRGEAGGSCQVCGAQEPL